MAIETRRSRVRRALGVSVSIFALTMVGWGIYINQTEAAAPFPEGQAEASACAYNRNTIRYDAGTQTPHRPDPNTDWVHCGTPQANTGQIRRIWLPDNAQSVEIFQVYGSEGEVVVKDFNSGREYFRQSTSGLNVLNKTVMTKSQYPNLGSIVLSIEFEGPAVSTTPGPSYGSPFPGVNLGGPTLPTDVKTPTNSTPGSARIHLNIKKQSAPTNRAPIANNDSASTPQNTAVDINLTSNDSDPDGNLNPSSAVTTVFPSHGTLNGSGNGIVHYTPNNGFTGSDSLTYKVCDTNGLCDSATATITVTPTTPAAQEFSILATPICANNQAMVRVKSSTTVNGANYYRLIIDGNPGPLHTSPEFVQLLPVGQESSYQIEALKRTTTERDFFEQTLGQSNTTTAIGRAGCTTPPPPAQVTSLTLSVAVQCIAGIQSNTFIWSPSSATANVNLFRDGQQIATSSAGTLSVTDPSPIDGQTHSYYVQSTTNTNLRSNTMQVATDQCEPPTPQTITPGDFTLNLSSSGCIDTSAKVELSWTSSENADEYRVERRIGTSGNFSTIANNLTANSYIDTSVNSNTDYQYRITARSSQENGITKASNNLTVTTEDCSAEQLPNLEIEVTPNEGIAPLTITATKLSEHVLGAECTWNFGDGTTHVSTADSVTHVYSTPGNYLVTLTCDQQTTEETVNVLADADVLLALEKDIFRIGEQVNFSITNNGPSDVELPNRAPFTIKSANVGIFAPNVAQVIEDLNAESQKDLFWTQVNNDGQQVGPGNYIVEARYLINNEIRTVSASFRIIDDDSQLQEASFTVDPTEGDAPLKINGTYTGPELPDKEIIWDFGDGNTGFGASVTHTYTEAGVYTIKLNAADFSGAQDIIVRGPIGTPETTENVDVPISFLASTGGSLLVALAIAFIISVLLSYFIVRRPFTKDEEN